MSDAPKKPTTIKAALEPMNRRTFLRNAAVGGAAFIGIAAALEPLLDLESGISLADLLQRHYKELDTEQKELIAKKQYGGTIDFDSAPGKGTTFRIYLPMITQ